MFKISDFIIKFVDGKIDVEHQDYQCSCLSIDSDTVKKRIHKLVDCGTDTVWSDGHHEEPATRVYIIFCHNKPVLIDTLDLLVKVVNSDSSLFELNIEDNLL